VVVSVNDQLKRTPLFDVHRKYGGRIIDYAGWALPVQFTGIIEEHRAVRATAGLFDVSDMGEVEITGPGALALVQQAVTADVGRARSGRVVYSPMCNHRGGVVDDILIYVLGAERYLAVVNAANIEKDFNWLQELARGHSGVRVENRSDAVAQLAIQGPLAGPILYGLTRASLKELGYYRALENVEVAGTSCFLVSRTGYTGEDGFELYCRPEDAAALWEELMAAGQEEGLVPAGLGCRDTLRLEAGMPLYGQELDDERTPLEAGLDRFVAWDKGAFVGREALQRQQAGGRRLALVGLEMVDRGVPRTGYPVLAGGEQVGYVTSGSYAPSLDRHIGMAYVPPTWARAGNELGVSIRQRAAMAKTVKLPFYRRNKEE